MAMVEMQTDPTDTLTQNDAFLINPNSSKQYDSNAPTILCCLCGTPIYSNPANMCINCIKSQVDITDGIQKQVILFHCRTCGRYQRPPFMHVELESKEMLNLCLKKIKGLNGNIKLINAVFVWTEHHSRRIKLKLTIQKEIFTNTILQQSFIVEFYVQNLQCEDCQRSFTEHTWRSCVQVRQLVKHKKTFYYLEQLLIKHSYLVQNIIEIKENNRNGLDFFYGKRSAASQLLQFLNNVVPIRSKLSKKLISQDDNSNTYNYKFTVYAEICPVCKFDLVVLDDKKLIAKLGNISNQIYLCTKITNMITLLDPLTLKIVEVSAKTYFDFPFDSVKTSNELIEFIVVDVERIDSAYAEDQHSVTDMRAFNKQSITDNHKLQLASFTLVRASDFGVNDVQYTNVISHLGNYLKVGDSVQGYDLTTANLSEYNIKQQSNLPDIVLVKKFYPGAKDRHKQRKFELRQLRKVERDNVKKGEQQTADAEYESFIQDIEEDSEMQQKINLYKKSSVVVGGPQQRQMGSDVDMDDADDSGEPQIDVNALLDGMDAVQIGDSPQQHAHNGAGDSDDDDPAFALAAGDDEEAGFGDSAGGSGNKKSAPKSGGNGKAKKGRR